MAPESRYKAAYINTPAGWRAFFISVLIAAVIGLGFRLYLSPPRLKIWVTQAIDGAKKSSSLAISFDRAEISLSHLGFPQIAIVLSDVKIAPRADCHPESSIFISHLRIPIRLHSLAIGRVAIGTVTADDLRVDLDGLHAPCATTAAAPPASGPGNESVPSAAAKTTPAREWWTDEQFKAARANIDGLDLNHTTLQFEGGAKEIYLESLSARFQSDGAIGLQTDMRIPPAVVYGEIVPPLRFEGIATKAKANLNVSVRVSEGSLETSATFKPGENQTVLISAETKLRSLPLSMLTPLLRKAGVVDQRFQPKFLWIDCDGAIQGNFQGLFQTNPFVVKNCKLGGDKTDIRLNEATRLPSGAWNPFQVQVHSLDLAKLLATMGVRGPSGAVSSFGQLSGDLDVRSSDRAKFNGALNGAELSFSNHKVRATQLVTSAALRLEIQKSKLSLELKDAKLENGEFAGFLRGTLDRTSGEGHIDFEVHHLTLDPKVQTVLTGGSLGSLSGRGDIEIHDSRIMTFDSTAMIGKTVTPGFRFDQLIASARRVGEEAPHVVLKWPRLELARSSSTFAALNAIAFGHEFETEWIDFANAEANLTIFSSDEIQWPAATATLDHGRISLTSRGSMNHDRKLEGELRVDYPKIKNLVWSLRGTLSDPRLEDQAEVSKFKTRAEITDAVLGL